MSTAAHWFSKAERWLDEHGRIAWLAVMIVGFIVAWPIGLAILFYMIWSKRMTRSFFACKSSTRFGRGSGNSAFDAYKAETLKRLEDEQKAFRKFLDRLREAKDKAEFEQFLAERNKPSTNAEA